VGIEHKNEEQIFNAAVQFESRAERDAYVAKACGDDQKLLAGVQALLQHHDANSFLDAPILEPDLILDNSPLTEGPGTIVGRYKLLERIGEGGMAVVYMAEQEKPIRRKVALKIIKLGMDTRSVIARFEAERQALAIMDHPNIAKVLDAGATETGRPYFVMELVPGLSMTEYCNKNRLSIKERVRLFITVCNAIQHAHQKGVIHRDIKPSNVMVTQRDGTPVPKVIDFGIAKATNRRLTEKTLFTRYAHIIGTPAYMSPEQAELSDLDVDTRTDIYSLGVLLYELLTGTTPFSEEKLRKAGYLQMQKVICEEEPTKPSTKLSKLGGALTDVAKCHNSSPELMPKLVRGDLDWIVMKSLEKDRARRYETADAIAADLRRHLSNLPVEAAPPAVLYRMSRYTRRHRQAIAAGCIFVLLIAVILWAGRTRMQAAQERDHARRLSEERMLIEAQQAFEARRFSTANLMVSPLLKSTYVGRPAALLQAELTLQQQGPAMAIPLLERLLDGQDEVAGQAHFLLARLYYESDPSGPGENPAYRQKWEDHRRQAERLLTGTAAYCLLRAKATSSVREMLHWFDKALDVEKKHHASLQERAHIWLAQRDYSKMATDAARMIGIQPDNPVGWSLSAMALRELDRLDEAIAHHTESIRLSPKDTELYDQRRQTYMRMGRYDLALADARTCVELRPQQPLQHMRYACYALAALGRYEEAEQVYDQIVTHPTAIREYSPDWPLSGAFNVNVWYCGYQTREVFKGLCQGVPWHPPGDAPWGKPFISMNRATKGLASLRQCARRIVDDGFHPSWSPDGTRLAFGKGLVGASGVAVLDLATGETELLTVPGRDPEWSPDGRFIAYVRDRQILPVEQVALSKWRDKPGRWNEVWAFELATSKSWRMAKGVYPSWSNDSSCIYYRSETDGGLYSAPINGFSPPQRVLACCGAFPTISPDGRYVADATFRLMRIVDVDSGTPVRTWAAPPFPEAQLEVHWSPDGRELSIAGNTCSDMGLWIYAREEGEAVKILQGPVTSGRWSPDGRHFAIATSAPYWEVWVAELDPVKSTPASFTCNQSVEEHCRDRIAYYERYVETNPIVAVYHWLADASLWIQDPKASARVEELDRLLREPDAEGCCNCARRILLSPPEIRERLMPLASLFAGKAYEVKPKDPDCLSVYALALCRLGRFRQAIEMLADRKTTQGSAVDCLCRALCRWHLGEKTRAREIYDHGQQLLREQPVGDALIEMFRQEVAVLLGVTDM